MSGDVAEAVRHARQINSEIKRAQSMDATELYAYAKELQVSYQLLKKTAELGRLPVVNFAAGGLGKRYCYVVCHIGTLMLEECLVSKWNKFSLRAICKIRVKAACRQRLQ